MSRDVQISGQN